MQSRSQSDVLRKVDGLRRRAWRETFVIFCLILVTLLAAPFVFYPVFLMKVLCFALFACAFNLLLGYGGLLSFGHAAYFGMAGYISAYVAKTWGLTPEAAIALGTVGALVMGLVFGAIAIRRQGIYFAMITLALAQMVYFFALQTPGFTGGEDGITSVPRGDLFGIISMESDLGMYFLVAAIFFLGLVAINRIATSPFGQVCRALRDNETRAVSVGFDPNAYKLTMFVLSAGLAGLAGATKSLVFQLASLTDVHWTMSGEPILMTLVGGLGTIYGPIIGALAIIAMQNYFARLGDWITVIQGLIFVLGILLLRNGVLGKAVEGYAFLLRKMGRPRRP